MDSLTAHDGQKATSSIDQAASADKVARMKK